MCRTVLFSSLVAIKVHVSGFKTSGLGLGFTDDCGGLGIVAGRSSLHAREEQSLQKKSSGLPSPSAESSASVEDDGVNALPQDEVAGELIRIMSDGSHCD